MCSSELLKYINNDTVLPQAGSCLEVLNISALHSQKLGGRSDPPSELVTGSESKSTSWKKHSYSVRCLLRICNIHISNLYCMKETIRDIEKYYGAFSELGFTASVDVNMALDLYKEGEDCLRKTISSWPGGSATTPEYFTVFGNELLSISKGLNMAGKALWDALTEISTHVDCNCVYSRKLKSILLTIREYYQDHAITECDIDELCEEMTPQNYGVELRHLESDREASIGNDGGGVAPISNSPDISCASDFTAKKEIGPKPSVYHFKRDKNSPSNGEVNYTTSSKSSLQSTSIRNDTKVPPSLIPTEVRIIGRNNTFNAGNPFPVENSESTAILSNVSGNFNAGPLDYEFCTLSVESLGTKAHGEVQGDLPSEIANLSGYILEHKLSLNKVILDVSIYINKICEPSRIYKNSKVVLALEESYLKLDNITGNRILSNGDCVPGNFIDSK